jgi:hypothetical protein
VGVTRLVAVPRGNHGHRDALQVRQHRARVPGGVQFDVPDTPAEVPRCHDANVNGGVRSWIAARRSDPVPVLLTIGGCVITPAPFKHSLEVFDAVDRGT